MNGEWGDEGDAPSTATATDRAELVSAGESGPVDAGDSDGPPAEQQAGGVGATEQQTGQDPAIGEGASVDEGAGAGVADEPREPGETGPADAGTGEPARTAGGGTAEQPTTEPERAGDTDGDLSDQARADVPQQYPGDYITSSEAPPNVDQAHESPESWAGDINPEKQADGRDNNCGECARAVQNTWNGEPAVAAAMADKDAAGEHRQRMSDWAGAQPQPASMSQVEQHVRDLGPGSSAIVGAYWNGGGGHWFNAVNDQGTVKAVDGQSGKAETWPPSASGQSSLGFDQSSARSLMAIYFDANGRVVK
jgi:Papain fold toxin 1, glutamine deamidase